jgi:hypothetical protein
MFKVARIIITSSLCNNYMPLQCVCQIHSETAENEDIPFLMGERISVEVCPGSTPMVAVAL